jgi:PKD repeat protein
MGNWLFQIRYYFQGGKMNARKLSQKLSLAGRWIFVLAFVVSLGASIFIPSATRAASPIFVNAAAPAGGDGASWATAFNNLQDGINLAVSGEEVWVAAGTYHPTYVVRAGEPRTAAIILKDGVAVYGGFAGDEDLLSEREWQTNVTVIDGLITPDAPESPYHVYHVVRFGGGSSPDTRLDGFTVTGGLANGDPDMADYGGAGIFITYTNMTLANLLVIDNHASGLGGGLNASYSPLRVEAVRFVNNSAREGGGQYSHSNAGIVVTNVVYQGNHATEQGGGLAEYMSTSALDQLTFVSNDAILGGGGMLITDSTTRITNSIFRENLAGQSGTASDGGAIAVQSNQQVWVQDCTFEDNEATGSGGAVDNYQSPSVWYRNVFVGNHAYANGGAFKNQAAASWIGNSQFYQNSAESMGGALDLSFVSTGVVTNSVFLGNHAVQGGAIRINGPHSSPRLTNLTVTNNSVSGGSPKGAALFQMGGSTEAFSTVVNSIFYGNSGAEQVRVSDAQMDLSHSIVATSQTEGTGVFLNQAGVITTDPLFVDPNGADNIAGNADDDVRVSSNSPAVDTGVPGDVDPYDVDNDADTSEPYPFHMGAGPRVVDLPNAPISAPSTTPAVDMGAYEAQPPLLEVVKSAGAGPLYEGASLPISITVTNTGLGTANDVVISDSLPAGLTMVAGSLTRSTGSAGTLPVLAQGFDLLPGASATVNFNAQVADGPASITNTASASAYEVITPVQGSVTMSVLNAPPHSIVVTLPAGTILEGSTTQYSGTYVDPAGALDAPYTASWNFGDGTAPDTSGFAPGHTYADSGTYNITLRVCDADTINGNDANCATSPATPVTITNVAPQVSIDPVGTGTEGTDITFTGSFTDPAGAADTNYTYTWTLDATTVIGSGTVTSYNPLLPPVVTATAAMGAGTHTVTLRVTDADGGSGTATSSSFTVQDVAPEVTISATGTPVEGAAFEFQANVVDPGLAYGETFTFSWNFGSGWVSGTRIQTHVFADSGPYSVSVRTTGSHGGNDTSPDFPVTVSNAAPTATISPVGAVNEGQTITFNGNFTDPAGALDTPYTYVWQLDGATTGSGSVATYNPAVPVTINRAMGSGGHSITLRVTDADGDASNLASLAFTVNNVAPTVATPTSGLAHEAQIVSFSSSFTDPGQAYGETYTYSWNYGDGNSETTPGATATHSYADSGSYAVTLSVTDSDGATGTSAIYTLVVGNVKPTAFINPVLGAVEGTPILFTGGFTDPAQSLDLPYTYRWLLDGVVIGSGTVNSYPPTPLSATAPASFGSHTIALEVTDQDQEPNPSTASLLFTVANVIPTVDVSAGGTAYDGVPYGLTAAFTDPGQAFGETGYTISWDFHGDGGSTTYANSNRNAQHAFLTLGDHTVTASVTDAHGGVGTDDIIVTVVNSVPVAMIGAITGNRVEGSTLTFNGSATDASPNGTLSYAWNFGDGSTGTGATATHAYRDNKTYTVTLTVTDNHDATGSDSVDVVIANTAPVVNAGDAPYGKIGQELQFQGSFTDAGLDDTHTILWDFGDGTTATGILNPKHSYAVVDTYIVTLTITDNDGGVGSDTTIANVDRFKYFIPLLIGGGH